MKTRTLGRTGLKLPWLSFGASSLGQEFRPVDLNEAISSVRVALDLGMNFIDTSPFYGRGMSECLLGIALRGVPRDQYILGNKLGRYDVGHFDFSASRVVESVDVSLHRMGVEHFDIMLCHDIEFVDMSQIVAGDAAGAAENSAAGQSTLRRRQRLPDEDVQIHSGPGRPGRHFVVQPLHLAKHDAGRPGAVSSIQRRRHHECRPVLSSASDQCAAARMAQGDAASAGALQSRRPTIAQLKGWTSLSSPCNIPLLRSDLATCIVGSANPDNVRKWAAWAEKPIDQGLLDEVLNILRPIHNWFYIEGRPENNDFRLV